MPRTHDIYGWVYFIECELTKRVKIGFSAWRPENRLMNLQTGSPTKLRVSRAIRGKLAVEQYLHGFFSPVHLHREWFSPCLELERVMKYIEDIPEDATRTGIEWAVNIAEMREFVEFARGKWDDNARLTVDVPAELLPSPAFSGFPPTPEAE